MFATEPEVAALLLARGASVSLRNAAGVTPLLFAAKYETPPLLGTLLAHAQPADLEASRAPGETPLLVALLKGDRAAVALLLRAGADVFNAAGGSLRPDQVGGACADLVAHRSSRVQLGTALQGAVQAHGNRERKLSVNFSQSHLYDRRIWRLVGRFVLE
jgi:ankyrin repeat protein